MRITGADLNLFEFDYDQTWAAFFLNAEGKVYGRYGARDAASAEARNSLAGLRYAMQAALETHAREAKAKPAPRGEPLLVERLPTARLYQGSCIHCHQAAEILREEKKAAGTWKRDDVWAYPLPENVGLTLEVDRGNVVKQVAPDSPAARAGLRAGDVVETLNGNPVHSIADAQYGLHRAPPKGEIPITWTRAGEGHSGALSLGEGWRKTNITWRPSLMDLLPNLALSGPDLPPDEKKALGLGAKRLAFRQKSPVHSQALAAGVQAGDIILGVNGQALEMTMEQFLGYVRRNYLVNDRVTLNLIRDGKRVDLPLKLRQ